MARSEEHTSEIQPLSHHSSLRSLPTRRSSDLEERPDTLEQSSPPESRTRRKFASQSPVKQVEKWPDRKSTRLKSSHLAITHLFDLSLPGALPISKRGLTHWNSPVPPNPEPEENLPVKAP